MYYFIRGNLQQVSELANLFQGVYLHALAAGLLGGASLEKAAELAERFTDEVNALPPESPPGCAYGKYHPASEEAPERVVYCSHSGKVYLIKVHQEPDMGAEICFGYPEDSTLVPLFEKLVEEGQWERHCPIEEEVMTLLENI